MVSFSSTNIFNEAAELRDQGLSDTLIAEELRKKGYKEDQINRVFSPPPTGDLSPEGEVPDFSPLPGPGPSPLPRSQPLSVPPPTTGDLYGRIEEIAEGIIDEKWDELIAEVQRIVEWKERIEEAQIKMAKDLETLKEDFKVLHQGVLGKLEDYDGQMRRVGTELKAVGKVFREVIPTFVDNVKELSEITKKVKR